MLPFLNQPEGNTMAKKESEGTSMPTVAEMRESQRKGSVGIGLNEKSYNEDQADFNQGCGDCPK
jgi:hypothetical protein